MPFEFKPTLESLDGVPQQFQGLYVANEGSTGFTFHPDFKTHVHGLTTALDKERKAAKDLKTQIQQWVALGETPEAVQTRIQELTEASTKAGEGKTNWEKLKGDLEAGHKKALATKDQEMLAMRATVERYLVDNEATSALAEAKGSVQLLLPHVKSSVKVMEENGQYVVRVVDKDGDPRGDGKGGFMTIKDLVGEMKASDVFGRAFESSGNTGGGKPPHTGGKPGAQRQQAREDMSPIDKIKAGLAQRK